MTDGDNGSGASRDDVVALRQRIGDLESANERLAELNEIKNHFLGMAAHDLRNPIGSVKGLADIMLDMDLPREEQRELLTEIAELVEQLRDVDVLHTGFDRERIGLFASAVERKRAGDRATGG